MAMVGWQYTEETGTTKTIIQVSDKPSELPFSPAILVKDTLYISGQLPTNPASGKIEGETMTQQAEQTIKNIEALLKKAGMELSNVVSTPASLRILMNSGNLTPYLKSYSQRIPRHGRRSRFQN